MQEIILQDLKEQDLKEAAKAHCQVFKEEFLSLAGPLFMRQYYKAWIKSPYQISFIAKDKSGKLLGVLLANYNPAGHYFVVVRRNIVRLGFFLCASFIVHPRFAKEVLLHRFWYYLTGVLRRLKNRPSKKGLGCDANEGRSIAELTHLFVVPEARGQSVGKSLVSKLEERLKSLNCNRLELVTPFDADAVKFYEALNFVNQGKIISRAGETFLKFTKNFKT
jgi:GNAT superfamily N-acetyltransferase